MDPMQTSRARRGATLIEVTLGVALGFGLLAVAGEAFRFFSTRSTQTTARLERARSTSLLFERLLRTLRFAQRVRSVPGGFEILQRQWKAGRWSFLRSSLKVSEQAVVWTDPKGQNLRYLVSESPAEIRIRQIGTGLQVELKSSDAVWKQAVQPLAPSPEKLHLDPGRDFDLSLEEAWFLQSQGWEPPEAMQGDPGSGSAPSASSPLPLAGATGTLSPARRPFRESLSAEANVVELETSPEGLRFLPSRLEGPPPEVSGEELRSRLLAEGLSDSEATLLGWTLTGMASSDRVVRAASLAAAISQLSALSPSERISLIEKVYPGLPQRPAPLPEADPKSPPRELLEEARERQRGRSVSALVGDPIEGFQNRQPGDRPFDFEDLQRLRPGLRLPSSVGESDPGPGASSPGETGSPPGTSASGEPPGSQAPQGTATPAPGPEVPEGNTSQDPESSPPGQARVFSSQEGGFTPETPGVGDTSNPNPGFDGPSPDFNDTGLSTSDSGGERSVQVVSPNPAGDATPDPGTEAILPGETNSPDSQTDPASVPPEDPGLVAQLEEDIARRDQLFLAMRDAEFTVLQREESLRSIEGYYGLGRDEVGLGKRGEEFVNPKPEDLGSGDDLPAENLVNYKSRLARSILEYQEARAQFEAAQAELETLRSTALEAGEAQPGREDLEPAPLPDASRLAEIDVLPEYTKEHNTPARLAHLEGLLPRDSGGIDSGTLNTMLQGLDIVEVQW